MSQSFRRTLVWAIVAVLLLLGALMQVKAVPTTGSPDVPADEKAQDALFQQFSCTISLLSLHLSQAEEMCGKAIALSPDSPVGYKFRGYAYLFEHRFERAETDLRKATELDADDPDNQAGLAQSLSGQGKFEDAIASFGIALKLQPGDVRYLSARCWALAGQGKDIKAALADCNLAIKRAPRYAVAYDARGLARLKQEKYALAVRDYSKALSLQKATPTALFGRGIAEWHLGQLASAWSDLTLARRANPEIDEAFILAGVLSADCGSDGPACSLPKALRQKPAPSMHPYFSASARPE